MIKTGWQPWPGLPSAHRRYQCNRRGRVKDMKTDFVLYYSEASGFCIAVMALMLIHDMLHSSAQEKQIWFNRSIVAFISYFFTDAFWAAVLGGVLPRARWLVVLLNLANYIILSVITYMWFMFVAASEKMPSRNSRKVRLLLSLPILCSVSFLVIAYIADPYFWIDAAGNVNPLYSPLLLAAPLFYILAAFILSIHSIRKTESATEKRDYLMIGVFPIGVTAFGLIQVFSLRVPTFCFGCTFMLLWFYIQHMQTLISVDDLTHLNNRGQVNRFLEQLRYRENVHITIMMIDIDNFKQINDTYGHAEGDRALIIVSEALKQTCEFIKAPLFLGRYGGDEFILIIQDPGENDGFAEKYGSELRSLLAEKRQQQHLPYELQVSIGHDKLRDKKDSVQACLVRADGKLYRDKKLRNAGR